MEADVGNGDGGHAPGGESTREKHQRWAGGLSSFGVALQFFAVVVWMVVALPVNWSAQDAAVAALWVAGPGYVLIVAAATVLFAIKDWLHVLGVLTLFCSVMSGLIVIAGTGMWFAGVIALFATGLAGSCVIWIDTKRTNSRWYISGRGGQ